jgi:hypothetical protein
VQHCITKEHLNNHLAIVLGPHGKVWQIELEINQSDVLFTGVWSQFLAFHGITAANSLLLRYEGNMLFTVKVFEPNGCQRDSKHKQIGIQQSEKNTNKCIIFFTLLTLDLNVGLILTCMFLSSYRMYITKF